MKAIVFEKYGSPDVLQLKELDKPIPKGNELLVRVHASSVNAQEWHFMRGKPYLMRMESGFLKPKDIRLGADLAGVVEAVGKEVRDFKPGDEVIGMRWGALAEYVTATEAAFAPKPASVSFEQAAAAPVAALTALQGLRDQGKVQPGQQVLINGAGGGVGTMAVQIAKALGAEITAVSNTANLEMLKKLGADHVIDYTQTDFTTLGKQYDVIFDLGGTHSLSDTIRALKPEGILVAAGSISKGNWLGPLGRALAAGVKSRFAKQKLAFFLAKRTKEDMLAISELLRTGKLTPSIDKTYPLAQTGEAIRYLEQGHVLGKIVITIKQ